MATRGLTHLGFDEVVCHLAGGVDEIGNPIGNDFFDDTYYRNGSPESFEGYCTDVFFRELGRFIEADSEKPFFAYLPLNAMHGPHAIEEEYAAPFVAMGHPLKRAKFYGMIINFDENLGRLMNTLEQRRIEKETIVVFMGDNGTAEGIGGPAESKSGFNAGMRGKKGSTHEGGHRVACFARLPGRFQAGRQVHQLTSHRDWLPTLIDLCDLKSPAGVAFDGQSIAPLLTSSEEPWLDRTFFIQRQADQPTLSKTPKAKSRHPHYAVLTEKWRMVDGQLYDHANDPGQTQNLAREHPEVVDNLYSQYEQHFAEVFAEGKPFTRFHIGGEENPTRFTVRDWHPDGDTPAAGRVIWQQEQLGDDSLFINGFWALEVVKSGQYAIRLSRFPRDAPAPINATSSRLQVGEHAVTQSIEPDAVSVKFDVNLPRGHALLQAWLTDAKTGNERGAYFVEVEYLRE